MTRRALPVLVVSVLLLLWGYGLWLLQGDVATLRAEVRGLAARQAATQTVVERIVVDLPERWFYRSGERRPGEQP